jgi:type II secretory pathway component PulK
MISRHHRRGYALVVVLFLLAVVFVGLGLLTQRLIVHQRNGQNFARKLQAQSLAEAGLDRAVAKLSADREFAGETWQPAVIGHASDATPSRVVVEVQSGELVGTFNIAVTATFPDHPTRRAQVVRREQIRLPAAD